MGPHVGVQRAQVGELLPAVAGHLAEERALAVHDLVVGQRQDEVLAEGVHQAERQLVVVVAAVDRVLLEVLQRVVHPAHVPLEAEAEAAEVGRPRDAGPRGRLLGRGDRRPGSRPYSTSLSSWRKRDRLEVLAAAVLVGHPLALPCASSRGRASTPRRRRAGRRRGTRRSQKSALASEEVADLVAAVVEDERAPVRVLALARVLVLVERGAVEARQRPVVAREVRRHPVEDHADARAGAAVDERAEVVGRAEARGRREVAGDLVAPRARRTGAPSPAAARRG